MSFKPAITKNVVSELLSNIVSMLSSASQNLSAAEIKSLVLAKIEKNPALFQENNDIGLVVSRLIDNCLFQNVQSLEELDFKYADVRDDDVVTTTLDMLAEGIATKISPVLYDLRVTLVEETQALSIAIDKQRPAAEALQAKAEEVRVFDWGHLKHSAVQQATIMFAQDKVKCFKGGVVRQHDSANILSRVPLNRATAVAPTAEAKDKLLTTLKEAFSEGPTRQYVDLAVDMILSERIYMHTLSSLKEAMSGPNLAANIVAVTDKIDAVEDVLRKITASMLDDAGVTAAQSSSIITNLEHVLVNVSLLRASMLFHKFTTMQNKLILDKGIVQESAMKTFQEAGGTEQMIKDHFTYLSVNPMLTIPNNGLDMSVVLNSSAKAHAAALKNADGIKTRTTAMKVKALQDAMSYSLAVHYKTALESGAYHPSLDQIHEAQVNKSMSALLKRSVDDIALEYLVTMRNNTMMTSFYKAINNELVEMIKSNDGIEVTPTMVAKATCSGVTAVIYDHLVTNFADLKLAA
jgi:hypothetical protein